MNSPIDKAKRASKKYSDEFVANLIEQIKSKSVALQTIKAEGMSISAFYARAKKLGYSAKNNKVLPHPKTGKQKYADEMIAEILNLKLREGHLYEILRRYNVSPSAYYYRLKKMRDLKSAA